MVRTSSRSGLGISRHQSSALTHPAIRRAVLERLEPRRLLTAVPITNASFENPNLSDGQSSATATGWSLLVGGVGGVVNPTTQQLPGGTPDGANAWFANTDGSHDNTSTATQTLATTYQPNTAYTLSAAATASENTYDYGVVLFAGGLVLGGGGTPSAATAGSPSRNTSPPTSAHFGQPLKVVLDSIMIFESGEQSVFIDDVTLDATLLAPPAPAAPTNLYARGASPSHVRLTWSDNAGFETGFEIQRKQTNGSWLTVHTTAANAAQWTESGLSSGTSYTYRVRAIASNAVGTSPSAYTSESTAPTFAAPPEIDDFEPASVVNWVPFASAESSSAISLLAPGHVGNGAMRVDYTIGETTNNEWGGAGLTYGWAVSQDWTNFSSIDLDVEGSGAGGTLYLEVFDNMNPATHAWEKFVYSFADDFTG